MHGSNQIQADDACRHAERLITHGDVHSNTDKMIFHNKEKKVTGFSHSVFQKKKEERNLLKHHISFLDSNCMFYLQSL